MNKSFDAFWQDMAKRSLNDKYRGYSMVKMPEDLRIYQHIIEASQPECIIEFGTHKGGSALWFADQLQLLSHGAGKVITVDTAKKQAPEDPRISYIVGDLRDQKVISHIRQEAWDLRAMVVEDSAHTYEVTKAALDAYHDLVSPGCYFVVEDMIVEDKLHAPPEWYHPGTVGRAVEEFIAEHDEFEQQFRLEYGISSNNGGWLKRR